MKKFIHDRKQLNSYKDFYEKIYKDLDGISNEYWADYENLNYWASYLDEFLWNYQEIGMHFIFKNFNMEEINEPKNYENYEWNIIFMVIKRFVQKYPNNTLEFINEED